MSAAAINFTNETQNTEERRLTIAEMCKLGLVFSTGQGGQPVDYVIAHKWFNIAATKGSKEARAYRAELAREMTPDQVAEAQRQAREWLAAHEGYLS
ncbi:MAG: hypothetical protein Tsb0010_09250 [Parvularculaceae bacterium]